MIKYEKSCELSYAPQELFNLVCDIQKYPQFLPWCSDVRIHEYLSDNEILAEMAIRFKFYVTNFTCKIIMDKYNAVVIQAQDGPFDHFDSKWIFEELDNNKTKITYITQFNFRSSILEKLVGTFFYKAAENVVEAFETRAKEIYG